MPEDTVEISVEARFRLAVSKYLEKAYRDGCEDAREYTDWSIDELWDDSLTKRAMES